MSERKVLNKYFPPDFDPNKVPRNKVKKNYTFVIRTMAPFHMRCLSCGEYIYKGRKFNSRHENVPDENYLGLRISRFYIKCPRCAAEIVFKTDIENQDYRMEAGATRCFENLLNARREEVMAAQKEQDELEKNPMKMVEMKARSTLLEEEIQGSLKDLEELRTRQRATEASMQGEKSKKEEEEDVLKEEEEELLKKHKELATKKTAYEKDFNLKLSRPAKTQTSIIPSFPSSSLSMPSSSNSNETAKLMSKLSQCIRVKKKEEEPIVKEAKTNPLGSLVAYSSGDDSNEDDSNHSSDNEDSSMHEASTSSSLPKTDHHEHKSSKDEDGEDERPMKIRKI